MDYFNKTYHPPGTPPGTLLTSDKTVAAESSIRRIDYSSTSYTEKELPDVNQCQPYLDTNNLSWIHIQGPAQAETIKYIGNLFKLHPLALEDVLNQGQRPKIDSYDDNQLFIIMNMPSKMQENTTIEQISIFLGKHYVISFHAGSRDPFEPLRERLRKQGNRIRSQNLDYLLYSIVDLIIDQGFPVLENFGEEIESIEDNLLTTSTSHAALTDIHRVRRELLMLRRSLWPLREVVNSLQRDESGLISDNTAVYLRDCYDHTIQILDLVENYREMATNLIDVYLSSSSHRLNESMRLLTMIATIFIPLSFVVGLYGMNFSHPDSPWAMPELHWYYGYPIAWAIMISIVIGMVLYFKKKNWL